jgi:predicted PurR-regulated permease PerM
MNIVPILGPYVIWIPAAVWLALQGAWIQALILTGWGMIVVGLIDNVLYPALVGNRIRLHTLPVFFSILGGLVVFGASGLILGPVILAIADALIQIWKHRTADGRSAETTDGDLVVTDGSGTASVVVASTSSPQKE